MRRFVLALGGGGAAFAAFLLLVGPVNWNATVNGVFNPGDGSDSSTSSTPSPTDETSDEPTGSATETPPTDDESDGSFTCDRAQAVQDYLAGEDFKPRDYVMGQSRIDWGMLPDQNDDKPFSSTPLRTVGQLQSFLLDDSAASEAALNLVGNDADIPDYWIPVQFQNPVYYTGNWFWLGDKPEQGGKRFVLAGDVWWFNLDPGCTVTTTESVRAVCGNVGFDSITLGVWRN